jgi:DNA primase
MSTQDWSRVVRKGKRKGSVDASTIPIGEIVNFYGGEVREGRNVSVRCCIHNDTRRSAVIDTYGNLYFCHTCGKGGSALDIIMEKEGIGFKDAVERADEILAGGGNAVRSESKRRGRAIPRRTWNI